MKELLDCLEKFNPTKIMVEVNRIESDSLLNVQYASYLAGKDSFDHSSEIYQIAFPLAKRLSHPKIYASDAHAYWFGADPDWENFDENAYLKERGQFEKSNRYDYDRVYRMEDSLKSVLTILQYLELLNTSEAQRYNHQTYLNETVLSGAGDNYIGAEAVAR